MPPPLSSVRDFETRQRCQRAKLDDVKGPRRSYHPQGGGGVVHVAHGGVASFVLRATGERPHSYYKNENGTEEGETKSYPRLGAEGEGGASRVFGQLSSLSLA